MNMPGVFPLGHIMMTAGINALINDTNSALTHSDLLVLIDRHRMGDDGGVQRGRRTKSVCNRA